MEDVCDIKAEFLRHLVDSTEHVGKRRNRYRAIQAHIVIYLAHRAERGFASQPNPRGFVGILRFAKLNRIMLSCNLFDDTKLILDFFGASFHFYDQKSLAVRIASLGESFAGSDARAVHELNCHRQNASLYDVRNTSPGYLVRVVSNKNRPGAFGLWKYSQCRFGDDSQLAFGATYDAKPIITAGIHVCPTDFDHGSIHENQRHTQEIVGSDPIFQAVRTARIHRNVACDGTGQLRGWVRSIEETVGFHCAGHT